jgi:hypothetical protein
MAKITISSEAGVVFVDVQSRCSRYKLGNNRKLHEEENIIRNTSLKSWRHNSNGQDRGSWKCELLPRPTELSSWAIPLNRQSNSLLLSEFRLRQLLHLSKIHFRVAKLV